MPLLTGLIRIKRCFGSSMLRIQPFTWSDCELRMQTLNSAIWPFISLFFVLLDTTDGFHLNAVGGCHLS